MGVEVNFRLELPNELAEHVALTTGDDGDFDSIGAYLRELIRRDRDAVELAIILSHKDEIQRAFAIAEGEFVAFDAETFLQEMRYKHG